MKKVDSFNCFGAKWTIKFQDGSELETEKLPIEIEYEYIGESLTLEPLEDSSEYYGYEAWWSFSNGLCPIRINGKWGFVNSEFIITIPPKFDFVGSTNSIKRACWRPEEFIHHVEWVNGECKATIDNKEIMINEYGEVLFNYETAIREKSIHTITDIIELCYELLPKQWKSCPWRHPELIHGIGLLDSEEALNCYMSSYGDMHVGKCHAALMNFPFQNLNGSIEIVDWGCGQGIGSATLIEALKQHDKLQWLRRVTLIEPASSALDRAFINVKRLTQNAVEIDEKNLFLPSIGVPEDNTVTSIGYTSSNVIHIFSNILDVNSIDLGAVARMVASSHGKHFVLCIGPKNGAAYRIEKFCSVFGDQEYFSCIDSIKYGHTRRTAHPYTCMTRCFVYNGAPLDLSKLSLYKETNEEIFDDYDFRLQIQNKVLSTQKARVAWRLEKILAIDDIMYIDAVINEVAVDFIIVRPNKGVLIVNLFEENLNDCSLSEDYKVISILDKKYQSPIDLVNLCQTSIKDGIEELLMSTIESSHNFSIIKKVVVFTENSISEIKQFFNYDKDFINYTYIYGKDFIEQKDVSLNLYKKTEFLYNNPNFDDVVMRKLATIISPSWHSYQEGRVDMHPIGVQKKLAESSRTQQKISGVAGSGKTQVLAFRAINAMKRTGGDVLVLTYNITLANYLKFRLSEIREDFSWEKIDIYPYHQFFRIRAAESKLHVGFGSYQDEKFFSETDKHKKYAAIFIDEVQDYTTEWLRIVMQNFLIEPNGEVVVFGDPKQNVYHRPLDKNKDIRLGVIGGEWNRQLTKGRRFTNPRLATLATSFQSKFLEDLPTDNITTENTKENALDFQIIKYIDMRISGSFNTLVDNIISIINNDNNSAQDFVVLASSTNLLRNIDFNYRQNTKEETEVTFVTTEVFERLKSIHHVTDERTADWKFNRDFEAIERARKQLFTTGKRCLKISTIQSFKGWESPSVILILENDTSLSNSSFRPMAPETIYTAITRARENLYIINVGNNTYHDFFNRQSL